MTRFGIDGLLTARPADPDVRDNALRALARIGDPRALPTL
ncbi:hypothetical protein [Dactylosporangium sp. NPDC051541]